MNYIYKPSSKEDQQREIPMVDENKEMLHQIDQYRICVINETTASIIIKINLGIQVN